MTQTVKRTIPKFTFFYKKNFSLQILITKSTIMNDMIDTYKSVI